MARLQHEVLLNIVDDHGSVEVPSQFAQILDENRAPRECVLSVQSMPYEPVRINLVDDPIGIVLGASCPDNQLVSKDAHAVQEFMHAWTHTIVAHSIHLVVMHQGLVKIQHKSVSVIRRCCW
jgi:hypothetical protein